MENSPDKSDVVSLEVTVSLKELTEEQEWPGIVAYVFGRSRRLLAKKPMELDTKKPGTGKAEFKLEKEREYVVKIGPDLENERTLKRYQPAVKRVLVKPGEKATVLFRVDKLAWCLWGKVPYLVTGTVEKREEEYNAPICSGEVDIYDVDIGYCFCRIPDYIVERLRDSIIDIIVDPPPVVKIEIPRWPDWDDWLRTGLKPPIPPIHADIIKKLETLPPEWAFAKQRFKSLPTARTRIDTMLKKMPVVEKRAWLNTEVVENVKVSQILYSNTTQFRELLVKNFQVFRFWLCWYPWIFWCWWPYCWWYSLEKLGTAELQPDGSFSSTVMLSVFRHDIPDLWFVIRQKINGVERVIYARHPVPCNTYWNHPSGTPVHLVVTDPSAVACYEEPETDLSPAGLWVLPLAIGNYSLKKIYGTGAGSLPADNAKIGLYETAIGFNDGPFGGNLGLRILFSPALESAGVTHYRIKYRVNGTGEWTPLTHEVVRHYSHYDTATESLEFIPYSLGPQTKGSENALFEIPPTDPPNKSTEPSAAWFVIDAKVDLMNGYFNTTSISNGFVEFKIELFDTSGNRINPAAFGTSTIAFKLPANDDVWNTISTADAVSVNSDLVVPDPEDPVFQAFIFQLQIDNRAPTAIIDEPLLPSGNTVDSCGMLRYEPSDGSIEIRYQARHPRKFAVYRFRLYRATTLLRTEEEQVGDMGPSGSFSLIMNLTPDILDSCPEAAFSEQLYIWNMAFNGWERVGPDDSATRAFALALP